MTDQQDIEETADHYTDIELFFVGCVVIMISLCAWAAILLGLFSLKDFVEYLINII